MTTCPGISVGSMSDSGMVGTGVTSGASETAAVVVVVPEVVVVVVPEIVVLGDSTSSPVVSGAASDAVQADITNTTQASWPTVRKFRRPNFIAPTVPRQLNYRLCDT